jgi:hypothetical protein
LGVKTCVSAFVYLKEDFWNTGEAHAKPHAWVLLKRYISLVGVRCGHHQQFLKPNSLQVMPIGRLFENLLQNNIFPTAQDILSEHM